MRGGYVAQYLYPQTGVATRLLIPGILSVGP
jgi:hypothetical protein